MSATVIDSEGTPTGSTASKRYAIHRSLTRRKLVTGSVAAAFLAATGDSKAQVGAPAATREVVDMMGPVIVPNRPLRVIANNNATIGNMLALGAKPIGADYNSHSMPRYLGDRVKGIVDVTGEDGIDIEKALALDPDLIVAIWGAAGEGWNQQNCERRRP